MCRTNDAAVALFTLVGALPAKYYSQNDTNAFMTAYVIGAFLALVCSFISVVACACAFNYGKRGGAASARKERPYMRKIADHEPIKDRVEIAEGSKEYVEEFMPMKGESAHLNLVGRAMKNPRAIVVPVDLAPPQGWCLCRGAWKDPGSIKRRMIRKIRE